MGSNSLERAAFKTLKSACRECWCFEDGGYGMLNRQGDQTKGHHNKTTKADRKATKNSNVSARMWGGEFSHCSGYNILLRFFQARSEKEGGKWFDF